jgi:hypothetical protein
MMLIRHSRQFKLGRIDAGFQRLRRCAVPTMGRVVSDSGERGRDKRTCDAVMRQP